MGHSFGGAAVIAAAHQIESVRAVAGIGAPYDPSHVEHNYNALVERILADGEAPGDRVALLERACDAALRAGQLSVAHALAQDSIAIARESGQPLRAARLIFTLRPSMLSRATGPVPTGR